VSDASRGLKFDRRLTRRRGWVDPEELRRYLDALPDVSDKIRTPEEAEGAGGAGGRGTPGEGDAATGRETGEPPAGV